MREKAFKRVTSQVIEEEIEKIENVETRKNAEWMYEKVKSNTID